MSRRRICETCGESIDIDVAGHSCIPRRPKPEAPTDMYYQGPAHKPEAPEALVGALSDRIHKEGPYRKLREPKPQADAAREWTQVPRGDWASCKKHKGMDDFVGCARCGQLTFSTHKNDPAAHYLDRLGDYRLALERVVCELAEAKHSVQVWMQNAQEYADDNEKQIDRSAKLLSALGDIAESKFDGQWCTQLAREAIREYEEGK